VGKRGGAKGCRRKEVETRKNAHKRIQQDGDPTVVETESTRDEMMKSLGLGGIFGGSPIVTVETAWGPQQKKNGGGQGGGGGTDDH